MWLGGVTPSPTCMILLGVSGVRGDDVAVLLKVL